MAGPAKCLFHPTVERHGQDTVQKAVHQNLFGKTQPGFLPDTRCTDLVAVPVEREICNALSNLKKQVFVVPILRPQNCKTGARFGPTMCDVYICLLILFYQKL